MNNNELKLDWEPDEWECLLFGGRDGGCGIKWTPEKDNVPNFFGGLCNGCALEISGGRLND